jgi:DNA-directed RNA polymerase specialized sigma24 family protein
VTTEARRSSNNASLRGAADPEELEDFHRRFFLPLVRRATWKHGLSKEDARDVVQDAFLLAVLKLRVDGNPKAWLTRVVDHLSLNFQRKTARRSSLAARWGLKCSRADVSESDSRPEDGVE